jgi:hypothetical protein
MKTPILLRDSFAGSLLLLLTLAGGMTTGLAQDLETLRKDRVAVIEETLTLMTRNYSVGLGRHLPIVPLRTELLHAHSELPRDQRLIFLKEAEQEGRKFEKMARARYHAGLGPESDVLLAKAGRLEMEIRLLEMKDSPAGFAQDLETLRKSRVGTLEQAVAQLTDHYSNGLIGTEQVMRARIDLFKARLAPSLPQAKKITLVENAIQEMRTFEKSVQDQVRAGFAHQSDALVTEAGRLGMEIRLLKMKGESSKLAQDVEILRKSRVATLERIVAMLTDGYSEGLSGPAQVISCQIELLETQSELDLPRVQKIALLGETLKQARAYENLVQGRVNAGVSPLIEQLLAKAGRLRIEIRLLELKALGDGPPKKDP